MGAVFALFAGFYFWAPKIIGKTYNDLLGKIHFWTMFVGVKNLGRVFILFKKAVFYFSRAYTSTSNLLSDILIAPSNNNLKFKADKKDKPRLNKDTFLMFFENVKTEKRTIYKKLRGKSGVYLFINNINNKLYVGSSLTLSSRMTRHFYQANSTKNSNIILYRAMKKYKLDNFSLAILELCEKKLISCLNLEQKWLDYYKPSYNVLRIAGTSSGFRHSIETINKLKEKFRKENHPKYGSTQSLESKNAISEGLKKFYACHSQHSKGRKGQLSYQYGINGIFVYCYNKKGEELIFPSINGAKQHFKIRWSTIKKNLDSKQYTNIQGEDWLFTSLPADPINPLPLRPGKKE